LKITKYFSHIISGDDVTKVKPDPEIFYLSANKLNVEISECVVLEDAQKGIDAAHAGGFKSIAIPNIHTNGNDFSKATMVLTDLSEVTPKLLSQLG
jgi:beta-phosphoglucomutase-like phosphatase (HAD superfamily)